MPRIDDREWTADEARESLSPMALAFAERYPGPPHGTETALAVGYSRQAARTDPERARRAASSKCAQLLRDPRVQAILRERRGGGAYSGPIGEERDRPATDVPEDAGEGMWAPPTSAQTTEDFLRMVMNSGDFPVGERTKAAAQLRQIEKDKRREQLDEAGDVLRQQRRIVSEALRELEGEHGE